MPIRPRFWETKIDGGFRCGIEFSSLADREAWLVDVRAGLAVMPPPVASATLEEPLAVRTAGRPSYDSVIDAAIEALGRRVLDPGPSLRDRAGLVQQYLASETADDDLPAARTIEKRIKEHVDGLEAPRQNPVKTSDKIQRDAKVTDSVN